MATLEIAGKRIEVGDEFLRMSKEDQDAAVGEIARSLVGSSADGAPKDDQAGKTKGGGITADNLVRAAARGIPVLGGAMDQFAALMDAATHPVLGRGSSASTFSERRAANLAAERAKDKAFDEESPIASTVAKVGGGVGPFFAAAKVPQLARGLGMTGPLRQQMLLGGASGGAIGAADAAVRGEDVASAAETNAMFGTLAPVVARGIGKAYQGIKGAVTPAAAPVAQRTMQAGGVDIPVSASVDEVDLAARATAASKEEAARKGAMGPRAQAVALDADQATADALLRAQGNISARLDPTGAVERTTAQEAGDRVVQDAMDIARQRAAAMQAQEAAAQAEAAALRTGIGGAPAAAGEGAGVVGRAVPAARQAAVDARTGAYRAAEDIPIEVDPSFRNVGETIRQRLAGSDDPAERLWVDPQTTSRANEALKILSDTEGGIFFNRAAPRPRAPGALDPVVEQVQGQPAADDTVAQLRARYGDEVARKYAEQASQRGPAGGNLAAHDVAVSGGGNVRVAPRVVEADSLITSGDAGYDKTLQPRQRDRAASRQQVDDIARNLNPSRLGASSEADRGAPIVGPDGLVESGNGRVQAVRQAYAEGGEAAARYRQWLADQGVDVSGFKNPVLVRYRATPMNAEQRQAFTVAANQSSTMSMSAVEKALADANLIDAGALASLKNPDLGAVENRNFVRQFFGRLPASERNALMTANGDLSAEGLARVRNAVLAKAYGDSPVLSRVAEATSDEVRSISNALTQAAPEWAALKAAIADGRVPPELDITKDLLDAVSRTARLRARGGSLESAMAQADAFGAQADESARLMRMFYGPDGKGAASASNIAAGLRHYAQEAMKVDASPGLGLGLPPVKAVDILEGAAARAGAPKALDDEIAAAARAERPAPAPEAPPVEPPKPIDARTLEAGRKRLNALYGDARRAALGNNDWSDVRAIGKIIDEYDAVVKEMGAGGKISGDWDAYSAAIEAARSKHAEYRNLFTKRGPNDPIGQAMEKIVGRYSDTAASTDEIARTVFGPESGPGGGNASRIAGRLKQVLAPEDFQRYQQGLFSYLVENAEGGMRDADKIATRIDKFLQTDLAKVAFNGPQRGQLQRYADAQRALANRPEPDKLDKIIAQIAGVETGVPMDGADVVNLVMKQVGKSHKTFSAQLVERLKRDLTPEGWTGLRQGVWSQLIESPNVQEFGAQALANRMRKFFDDPMAKVLYSPDELREMKQLAAIYEKMMPPKGSAPNTSNTAMTLAKFARAGQNNVLALIGAGSGGLPGAIIGGAVERGGQALLDRRAAKEATELFLGKQPRARAAPVSDPVSQLLLRGVGVEAGRD